MQSSAIRITRKHSGYQQETSKNTNQLLTLKKTTQNFPLLQNTLTTERNILRQTKSRGKLRMGSTSKPLLVLSKEQRKDPFHRESILIQDVLNKKGLMQLQNMGVLKKQMDCYELLNLRYEMPVAKVTESGPTFLTNPAILINTYYENTREKQTQNAQKLPNKEQKKGQEVTRVKKVRSSKKKVIKKEEPPVLFVQDIIKLTFLHGRFQQDQIYLQYVRSLRRKGQDILFKLYSQQIALFAKKYNLKKFTIIPALNQTKRITEQDILKAIPNSKILGFHRRIKGSGLQILANFVWMKVAKMRLGMFKLAVRRMQKVKNKFKIKKYYREMLNKRWQYLIFKLGAFAQGQRRAMENMDTKFDVQIHLLTGDRKPQELGTFYKHKERTMSQLLRLYNNEADHMILLHDGSIDCQDWVQEIEGMHSTWKKPSIHIIQANLQAEGVQETGNIYFGLTPAIIRQIKQLCQSKKAVLIPYRISKYLPYICQTLNVELFGGAFSQEGTDLLFEEEVNEQKNVMDAKFKKLKINSFEMTNYYKKRLARIVPANQLYHSKTRIKQLFKDLGLPTPPNLSNADINNRDFFRQFVKFILKEKDINRWILKLPSSTFSRGLALFETESLKIIKENKKKQTVSEQVIDQIAKIMQSILVQKVQIPHNSLSTGQQFVTTFKASDGYVQSYLQGMISVALFGRIDFNGVWTLLGSYRKYYAENICFGALYPGITVTVALRSALIDIAAALYKQNVFGYLTVQLLVQPKSGNFYFIDLVPHLQSFSCLYFYYRRLLDMNQFDGNSTQLTRKLFYCPFIDNNGNKTESLEQFRMLMTGKKINFDEKEAIGTRVFRLGEGAEVLGVLTVGLEEGAVLKQCLEALRAMVELGGQFNKFDKKVKSNQSDGLYILDVIWKLRQMKKEVI